MKFGFRVLAILAASLLLAGAVWAKPPVYKWVEDPGAGSDQLLREAQSSRVVSLPEAGALKAVRQVMTEDLFLALAEYHPTRHRQDAETVGETVLPEKVVGKAEIDLADETFRFVLRVRLKAFGNRTRVLAQASPIYLLRDEQQEEGSEAAGGGTVEMKIKAPAGAGVSVGRIYIEPLPGLPQENQVEPLPDAADRAQKLVRSFLFLLDQRLAGNSAGR